MPAPTAAPTPPPAGTGTGTGITRRSRVRRAGESAFGALLLARLIFMGLLAMLLLVAGVWQSWDGARLALLSEPGERGTMTLRACDDDACLGSFDPAASGDGVEPRDEVVLGQSLGREPGDELSVALRPGTGEAVRTGLAGALSAFLPLTGALLLAAVVIAGGLRIYRLAWATGGLGLAALTATFVLW